MHSTPIVRFTLFGFWALICLGCNSNVRQQPGNDSAAMHVGRADAFSSERAWADLEALAAFGPRAVGTEGSAAASFYIESQLAELGLSVERRSSKIRFESEEFPSLELLNLEAEIPGDLSDVIVLAAPFDSAYRENFEYRGVNDGASGAALLLEVARVIAADPLPYTIRLLFLGGEAPLGRGAADDRETRYLGSTAAANRMKAEHQFDSIRLLLMINRVSDADLRIARDRFSQRTYRDVIWKSAADLGHADVFDARDSFEAPLAGHRVFIDYGFRRVVAIVDPQLGSDELPAAAEHTEDDTLERSSRRSLEVVGEVVLAGLEAICARLEKIDRFSEVPILDDPAPQGDPVVEPETEAEPAVEETAGHDAAPQQLPATEADPIPEVVSGPGWNPASEAAEEADGAETP